MKQIKNHRLVGGRILALLLSLLMLVGLTACQTVREQEMNAALPTPTPLPIEATPESALAESTLVPQAVSSSESILPTAAGEATHEPPEGAIIVSTVDALLNALSSDATIYLEAGLYQLDAAATYGQEGMEGAYYWEPVYDGYELRLNDLKNLRIIGADRGLVRIETTPRYAALFALTDCENIELTGITTGHTHGAGDCTGAVLLLDACEGLTVTDSLLYGCGTLGVEAYRSNNLTLTATTITDCSQGAVNLYECDNVWLEGCEITACGRVESPYFPLINLTQCRDVVLTNCELLDNACYELFSNANCTGTMLLGSNVQNNTLTEGVFFNYGETPTVVAGCSFIENAAPAWYAAWEAAEPLPCVTLAGESLRGADLGSMVLEPIPYERIPYEKQERASSVMTEPRTVSVSTVDELLAAIDSNTTILLADGVYDLSTAADYGLITDGAYNWLSNTDGPGLSIEALVNLHLIGNGPERCRIVARPRYADVLYFANCATVSLTGLTLGHVDEPGTCSGGVLFFDTCSEVAVTDCGLFGCGILGIQGIGVAGLVCADTEIYDCSEGAASFFRSADIRFNNCNIHDCALPQFFGDSLNEITVDGLTLSR